MNSVEVLVGITIGAYVGRGGGGGMLELKVTLDEMVGDISNELAYGWGGGIFGLNPIPNGLLGGLFGLIGGGKIDLGKFCLGFWLLVLGKYGLVCWVQNGGEWKELFGTTGLRRGGGGEFIDEVPIAGNDCLQLDELGLRPGKFEQTELWK